MGQPSSAIARSEASPAALVTGALWQFTCHRVLTSVFVFATKNVDLERLACFVDKLDICQIWGDVGCHRFSTFSGLQSSLFFCQNKEVIWIHFFKRTHKKRKINKTLIVNIIWGGKRRKHSFHNFHLCCEMFLNINRIGKLTKLNSFCFRLALGRENV